MNPEIVLGPPGTGKTTTLLGMVDEELERGAAPERVGYISFTKRAASEAAHRALARFKLKKTQLPWFRTIHSLCFAALGLTSSDVLEGAKLREFGDWLGVAVSGKVNMEDGTSFGFEVGDRCLFMENLARVRGVPLRELYAQDNDGLAWPIVERVARGLTEYKKMKGLLDFTDMLEMFVETDWTARLEVLFVDEAQDLSLLQWRVVEKLARGARRVVVAGDDDQAIYRWAGAAVDHFVGLPGRVRVLEQSWRVPEAVRGLAEDVIGRVSARRPKAWLPRLGDPGAVERIGDLDELDWESGEDVLVLARNTCFLRDDAMPLLRSKGVVYEFRGAPSVRQSALEAVLDWERLRRGEAVPVPQVRKIYEQMEVGVGFARGYKKLPGEDDDAELTMAQLRERGGLLAQDAPWFEVLELKPEERVYMRAALKRGEKLTRRPTVRLSTIHGSKGGEADHVVLVRDLAERTAKEALANPEDEARCWYVAATRARKKLTVLKPQTRRGYEI